MRQRIDRWNVLAALAGILVASIAYEATAQTTRATCSGDITVGDTVLKCERTCITDYVNGCTGCTSEIWDYAIKLPEGTRPLCAYSNGNMPGNSWLLRRTDGAAEAFKNSTAYDAIKDGREVLLRFKVDAAGACWLTHVYPRGGSCAALDTW